MSIFNPFSSQSWQNWASSITGNQTPAQQQSYLAYGAPSGSANVTPYNLPTSSPTNTGKVVSSGANPNATAKQLAAEQAYQNQNTGGQTLGTQTPGGGDVGSYPADQYKGWDPVAAQADWKAKGGHLSSSPPSSSPPSGPSVDDLLNQGYNDYYAQLDAMLPWLQTEKNTQTQAAQSSYDTGVSALGTQLASGQELNNQNQAKSLRDLSANLRNSFMGGNNMLGAAGAGDSSAANQYAYALTKLGNQQRGDIMQEITNRGNQLKDAYNTAVNGLKSTLDSKIADISSWFSDQQRSLLGMKATAAQQKSQQILNIAIQGLQTAQTDAANKKSVLETWVANNSKNIGELKTNWQSMLGEKLQTPTTIQGTPTGFNTSSPTYVSQDTTRRKDIWGNYI